MFTLAYPWLLALLLLPLLVRLLVPPYREVRRSLVVPFLDRLVRAGGRRPEAATVLGRASLLHSLSLAVIWGAVVLALARPQLMEQPITKEISVRDLLLAVDLSGSMETRDFHDAAGAAVDRLTAVKTVLDGFLARRQGDRVGLILFGSAPFVQAPFTEDLKVCRALLAEARVNMAGPQTAFGDAIGLAVNVFDRSQLQERVLIVLTDGNDTASRVPPAKAAEVARDKGIVIHAVSVGDPGAVGEDALDVETLKQVATTTGGLYAHAADMEGLQAVYRQLDRLETRKARTITHRPKRDVYWWPLAFGLAVSLLVLTAGLVMERSNLRSRSSLAPPNHETADGEQTRAPGTHAAVRS